MTIQYRTSDTTYISVGDYSAQVVVNTILRHAFPVDPIVGEEDAAELRLNTSDAIVLKNRIVALANEALMADLGAGEIADWGLGSGKECTPEQLLDAIDRGRDQGRVVVSDVRRRSLAVWMCG